jgi:hypothetical protein
MKDWMLENGTGVNLANYADYFAANLADDAEALKEFGAELNAMAEQERVYNQAIANAALSAVDTTKLTED